MKKFLSVFLLMNVIFSTFAAEFIPEYKIGDEGPGGGIVFYISEKGFLVSDGNGNTSECHYLEFSKDDIGGNGAVLPFYPEKANAWELASKKLKTDLGSGKENTLAIITYNIGSKSKALSASNCAALACYEYTTSTTQKGDWFLPSFEELRILQTAVSFYLPNWASSFSVYKQRLWGEKEWYHAPNAYLTSSVPNRWLVMKGDKSLYPTYTIRVALWVPNSENSTFGFQTYVDEIPLYTWKGMKQVYAQGSVRAVHAF